MKTNNETGEIQMSPADEIEALLTDLCGGDKGAMIKALSDLTDKVVDNFEALSAAGAAFQKAALAKLKAKMNIKEG